MHSCYVNIPFVMGNETTKTYVYFDKYKNVFRVTDEISLKKELSAPYTKAVSKYLISPQAVNNSPDNLDDDYYLRLYDPFKREDGDYLYISSDDQYRVSTTPFKYKADVFNFMSKDSEKYGVKNTKRFFLKPKYSLDNIKLNEHSYIAIHYNPNNHKDYSDSYLFMRPGKLSEDRADDDQSLFIMAVPLHIEYPFPDCKLILASTGETI